MRVGALEETITVTGEAPIVDVQSTTRQRVMDAEAISTLPTGRNMFELGVLIPGVSMVSHGRQLATTGRRRRARAGNARARSRTAAAPRTSAS